MRLGSTPRSGLEGMDGFEPQILGADQWGKSTQMEPNVRNQFGSDVWCKWDSAWRNRSAGGSRDGNVRAQRNTCPKSWMGLDAGEMG
jgi:hypothetical protein